MNETIRTMMNHRSVRKFRDAPVSMDMLHAVVSAAQMASTSSNMQAYSVIHVSDRAVKGALSEIAGQSYVAECPVLLVWCADLYRLKAAYQLHGDPDDGYIGTTENTMAAMIDVALAAQNAAVAAESMGLGVVYIGSLRNDIEQVSSLLKLPELVVPAFGMCLGYPAQQPMLRPRLPESAVLHQNRYQRGQYPALIEQYDETMRQYITERTQGKRAHTWSQDMYAKLKHPARMNMRAYLEKQGFLRDTAEAE